MTEEAKAAAERMNARALAEGEEGGEWSGSTAGASEMCEACGDRLTPGAECVSADCGGGAMVVCLPCVKRVAS